MSSCYIGIFAVIFARVKQAHRRRELARKNGGLADGDVDAEGEVSVGNSLKKGLLSATKEWKDVFQGVKRT